jgi:hypothetical protein
MQRSHGSLRHTAILSLCSEHSDGRSVVRGPLRATHFFFSKTSRPAVGPIQEPGGRGVKLTTHLPLMSRLRISGAIPLRPLMVRTRTTAHAARLFHVTQCAPFASRISPVLLDKLAVAHPVNKFFANRPMLQYRSNHKCLSTAS